MEEPHSQVQQQEYFAGFARFARLIKFFCFISPSPGHVVRPVAVSDQRRSTREPCSRKDRDPDPAASHTPDPLTSVQREHQHHLEKENRK